MRVPAARPAGVDQATVLIVPGWRGSGPAHWQSRWAATLPRVCRVEQDDWVAPVRTAWVDAIGRSIEAIEGPVIVVAHSLGCIATVHLPEAVARRVQAALLVAPADPERRAVLSDFAPVPHTRLPYPSWLVASSNDPYCPLRLAAAYARAWGSRFIKLDNAGHINVASGHGDWPQGLAFLRTLASEVACAEPAG